MATTLALTQGQHVPCVLGGEFPRRRLFVKSTHKKSTAGNFDFKFRTFDHISSSSLYIATHTTRRLSWLGRTGFREKSSLCSKIPSRPYICTTLILFTTPTLCTCKQLPTHQDLYKMFLGAAAPPCLYNSLLTLPSIGISKGFPSPYAGKRAYCQGGNASSIFQFHRPNFIHNFFTFQLISLTATETTTSDVHIQLNPCTKFISAVSPLL